MPVLVTYSLMQQCWEVGPAKKHFGQVKSTHVNAIMLIIKGLEVTSLISCFLVFLCLSTMGYYSKKSLIICSP